MITVEKPEKYYHHDCGDFIYGDENLIGHFDKKLLNKNILPLNFGNTVDSATKLVGIHGVTEFMKQFEYECPFNRYIHKAVIPVFVASEDSVTKYFSSFEYKPWFYDLVTDQKWIKNHDSHKCSAREWLTGVQQILIGSGYTDMCYPSDGNSSLDFCSVPLSNGDTLVCVNLVWHNK